MPKDTDFAEVLEPYTHWRGGERRGERDDDDGGRGVGDDGQGKAGGLGPVAT
ncbi:hypothetical protein Mapa_008817 [Marchantia paleacea]|nr:hypothetical protein Mapa_008817 [Marchantia paleacea]